MAISLKQVLIFLVAWIVAIAIAMTLDAHVAQFVNDHHISAFMRGSWLAFVLKMPGEFAFTAAVAVVVTIVSKEKPKWHAGAFILLCGLLSGLNALVKWLVGRARPFHTLDVKAITALHPFWFHPLDHGLRGLNTPNLSFPSGHAALAFATAGGLAILYPRGKWIFYVVGMIVALERISENAHYLSDTVGAAMLGIGGAYVLAWLFSGKSTPPAMNETSQPAARTAA